ncbi:hypothetical protein CW362_09185 [Streptomyces populi]|uniref:Uncharacterized protein n=1 Tax=Streptomyces populi TaxID=2058924 RepID=A0A2I0STQ6_9ACTN|nr:hypothetical protein CW362_09185 [Streptomyces populi]
MTGAKGRIRVTPTDRSGYAVGTQDPVERNLPPAGTQHLRPGTRRTPNFDTGAVGPDPADGYTVTTG